MKNKITSELENEIRSTTEIQNFFDNNENEFTEKPLYEYINVIINEHAAKKSTVVARSGLNRIYAYQLLSGKRLPSRDKLIALAFGLELSNEETNSLLKYAGFSVLYARNKRDAIIIKAITEKMNIFRVNEMLFDYNFDILTS